MPTSWWELPGPTRFISGITRSLREGQNVVICLPLHVPKPLSSLRSLLGHDDGWAWTTLRLREESCSKPLKLLFSRFAQTVPASELHSPATLIQQDSFCGRLLYIEEITPTEWREWKSFIQEYEHVCRTVPRLHRTVFCICIEGEAALDPPTEDVCISVHRYDNYVRNLDTLLYTLFLLEDRAYRGLEMRIAAFSIAAIALWDPLLAERLAAESLGNIVEPSSILQEIARERGWTSFNGKTEQALWQQGIKGKIDGTSRVHSAALAMSGKLREIEQRIWSAEVAVLFPYLEEKRQELIAELRPLLRVPFTKRTGEIVSDLRDLEIGHIESQIKSMRLPMAADKLRFIECLRQVRNHLSHFQVVPPEILKDRELLE